MSPFNGPLFNEEVIKNTSSYDWWKSFFIFKPNILSVINLENTLRLLTAVASLAGVERTFSSFGQVHTKLQNKLGVDKASKLTFLYKQFNK